MFFRSNLNTEKNILQTRVKKAIKIHLIIIISSSSANIGQEKEYHLAFQSSRIIGIHEKKLYIFLTPPPQKKKKKKKNEGRYIVFNICLN